MEVPRPQSKTSMPSDAKLVFKGVIFEVFQWQQDMYDGSKATFEKLRRADTVCIIPVLPDGQILLIEEEQPNYRRKSINIPSGRAEPDEDALTSAKRELLEETGYEADEWLLWDAMQPAAKIDWAVFTFVAKGLRKVADKNLDPGEKIELAPVSQEKFLQLAENSDFAGPHIMKDVLTAKADPAKRSELIKLLS